MSRSLGVLTLDLIAKVGGWDQGMERAGRSAQKNFKKIESDAQQMSRAITRVMGSVVAALSVREIVRDIASFEQAMLGVKAVSGATAEQFATLEKQARELGATSVFSAQQAAEAQRFLAMAGFNANQVLEATPGILELAAAASIDLGTAADLASNALSGFRLPVQDLGRLNDVLAKTANSANTSVQQLGQALSYAAPISAAAGVSLETTAAAIGALSDAGLQGSRAGTGFLGVIRQLSNVTPVAAATLEKYGLGLEDVDVTTRGLQPVLETLAKANISTADAFKIFGSEAGTAAQILIGSNERVEELTELLGGAEGAAAEAAATLSSGLTASIKGFTSAAAESVLRLGDAGLAGALKSVIDTGAGVLSFYNGMLPQFAAANDLSQEQEQRIRGVASALNIVAGAASGYLALATATKAATVAQAAFNVVARANPYIFIASAIGAATVAIYEFATAQDRTLRATERLWEDATQSSAAYQVAMGRVNEGQRLNDQLMAEQARKQDRLNELREKGFKRYSGAANEATRLEREIAEIEEKRARLQNLRMDADKAEMERRRKGQEEEIERQRKLQEAIDQLRGGAEGSGDEAIGKRIAALELEAQTLGMTSIEADLYKLRLEGATDSQLAAARAALEVADAHQHGQEVLKLQAETWGLSAMQADLYMRSLQGVSSAQYEAIEAALEAQRIQQEESQLDDALLTAQSRYATEEEQLVLHHENLMAQYESFREKDALNQELWDQVILDQKSQFTDEMNKLDDKRRKQQLAYATNMLSEMSGLMSSRYRALFEIGKVAALANIAVMAPEKAEAAAGWGMKLGGPPLAAAFTAASYLVSAAHAAEVASASFGGGGAKGGGGISGGVSTVPAAPAPIQLDGAAGSGGQVQITFNGPVNGLNERQLAENIRDALKESIRDTDFVLIEPGTRNGRMLSGE